MKILRTKKKRRAPFETFCSLMADTPDSLQNIMILVRLMFTMSPSTAACERGFSAMNTIKNIRRIRMGDDTLSTLMGDDTLSNSMHQIVKEFDAHQFQTVVTAEIYVDYYKIYLILICV